MARIAGINIPPHQHAEIGLTAIYGIGRPRARTILDSCGIEYSKKIKDLSDANSNASAMPFRRSRSKATCVVKSSCRSSV